MQQEQRLATRSREIALSPERQITYPRPSELFSRNSPMPKRAAIVMAVTRLAALFRQTMNEAEFRIYADAMEGMELARLKVAFEEAERSCRFLPTPGELRALVPEVIGSDARPEPKPYCGQCNAGWLRNGDRVKRCGCGGNYQPDPPEQERMGIGDLARVACRRVKSVEQA